MKPDLITYIAGLLSGQDAIATLSLASYFADWGFCHLASTGGFHLVVEWLRHVVEGYPRVRRFGELITDIGYPITSRVLGNELVPFPRSLRRIVEMLKQMSDYIFQPPYNALVRQIEELQMCKSQEGMNSEVPEDEYLGMPKRTHLRFDDSFSLTTSFTRRSPSPILNACGSDAQCTLAEGSQLQSLFEDMATLMQIVVNLNTKVELLALRMTGNRGICYLDDTIGQESVLNRLPVSVMRGAGVEAQVTSETANGLNETKKDIESPMQGYVIDSNEDAIDRPPSIRASIPPSPSSSSSLISFFPPTIKRPLDRIPPLAGEFPTLSPSAVNLNREQAKPLPPVPSRLLRGSRFTRNIYKRFNRAFDRSSQSSV